LKNVSQDVNDCHLFIFIKIGVAPFASQVADSKSDEDMWYSAPVPFTLYGMKDFYDVVSLSQITGIVDRFFTRPMAFQRFHFSPSEFGSLD
jgi:hypothetical protein